MRTSRQLTDLEESVRLLRVAETFRHYRTMKHLSYAAERIASDLQLPVATVKADLVKILGADLPGTSPQSTRNTVEYP